MAASEEEGPEQERWPVASLVSARRFGGLGQALGEVSAEAARTTECSPRESLLPVHRRPVGPLPSAAVMAGNPAVSQAAVPAFERKNSTPP